MTDLQSLIFKIIIRIAQSYIKSIKWYRQEKKIVIQLKEDSDVVFGQLYPFLLDLANQGIDFEVYG